VVRLWVGYPFRKVQLEEDTALPSVTLGMFTLPNLAA